MYLQCGAALDTPPRPRTRIRAQGSRGRAVGEHLDDAGIDEDPDVAGLVALDVHNELRRTVAFEDQSDTSRAALEFEGCFGDDSVHRLHVRPSKSRELGRRLRPQHTFIEP